MTRISQWQAARTHPHTYPGAHPAGAFILLDDDVHPLDWPDIAAGSLAADLDAPTLGERRLAEVLSERRLPGLVDRFPVLAYGGNRNPATLALKLQHYDYRSPGSGVALPVLTATLRGFDVVGAALSGQGYLYADLISTAATAETELAVHVLLPDADQLRVLHDSEGVQVGMYDVGILDGVTLRCGTATFGIDAMAYLARSPYFVSPTLGTPLAFTAVHATGRTLPTFDTLPMLAHALASTGLLPEVDAVVRPPVGAWVDTVVVADPAADGVELAAELMRYLNGQWWFRRHTGLPGLRAADEVTALISTRLLASSTPPSRDRRSTTLSHEDAYAADWSRSLGGMAGPPAGQQSSR